MTHGVYKQCDLKFQNELKKDMNKFEEINHKRKESNARFEKLNSRVYKLFLEMGDATFCDGALPKKTKELIAIAIGAVTNCESCMQWHIEQAYKDGATIHEVMESLEVAIDMGVGPVTVNARFALDVMENTFGKIK